MPSINAVFLGGYCEGEPRLIGDEGTVTFRIRLHEMVKGRERGRGSVVRTEYFTVKAPAAAAGWVAGYVSDGSPVVVTGKLKTDRWTSGGGEKKRDIIIEASSVQPGLLTEDEELVGMGAEGSDSRSAISGGGGEAQSPQETVSIEPTTAPRACKSGSAPNEAEGQNHAVERGTFAVPAAQKVPW